MELHWLMILFTSSGVEVAQVHWVIYALSVYRVSSKAFEIDLFITNIIKYKGKRWYTFENMGTPPSPRYGSTLTVVQNKIYVFGGESIRGRPEDGSHIYILDCCKILKRPTFGLSYLLSSL